MLDRVDALARAPLSKRDLLAHYADVRARLMGPPPRPARLVRMVPPAPSPPAEELPATPAEAAEALPADVVAHVVEACEGVHGLLDRVMKWMLAYNELKLGELTCDVADAGIRQARETMATQRISVALIIRVASAHYRVSREDILSQRRTADVIRPRQVAMYLAKTLTPRSLPEVGHHMGGRDHTTVLHAVRKIGALIERDDALAAEVAAVSEKVKAEAGL